MEKVFEQPLKKPLEAVRKNIRQHVAALNKQYKKQKQQFKIEYSWEKEDDALIIASPQYGITAVIKFTKSKIVGYIEIPFLLKAVAWAYKDHIIKEVLKELNAFLKKI